MSKNLVIVESPSKSKTIEKYLGSDYKVVSSKGHIRDLTTTGKFGFGVDVDDGFKPSYAPIKGKKSTITELKKLSKDSDRVYLASDPDREGEAIAWHLKDALGLDDKSYDRIVFNEITKNKILDAFKNPRKIDDNLVKSQETRRILDRIIGFRLSKLMQSKTGGKSAGRVQSVALKLIVDREREILAFTPEAYYTITGVFDDFDAELFAYKDDNIEIKTPSLKDEIMGKLSNDFTIFNIEKKKKNKKAKPPFTTSTLQQVASTRLNFSGKKTMTIAQKLYEGIDTDDERTGLITYMRTDSIRLSDEFVKSCYAFIDKTYGKEYVGYVKTSKDKSNVQDAHEGIRPTDINNTPHKMKKFLTDDEYKLYKLIYYRALSSLMKDANTLQTTIILDNNDYRFKVSGSIITFDGYLKTYGDYESSEDKILPNLEDKLNTTITCLEIVDEEHFTKPKPRYTEAKLIKELEELGIGRPSTYVKIIDTLKERGYIKLEDKKFFPTDIGIVTTDKLQEFFSNIINVEYTRNMEEDLDKIAEGEKIWNVVLEEFYEGFEKLVEVAFKDMDKEKPKETGQLCPECGKPLVIRKGKYGEFVACSNYPECKYVKKEEKVQVEVCKCPNCEGMIIERKTKRGKLFYGCNRFPKCKTAYWDKPTSSLCPTCNNILLETKDGIKCSKCDYIKKND
ncbi:MAG: type I DNA topoisomerase [bacterium]|nr:type I DNA topoisomerase [bacterium]